jgi:DNA modification methylase
MPEKMTPLYHTVFGKAFVGDALDLLDCIKDDSINLVITSPPFALLREKEYGNKPQEEYVDWLTQFARKVKRILRENGSFILDLGGAYEKGKPIRSLYNYRILIKFCDDLGFNLAEEFFWYNPAKLPSPIEWVNKRKIRVKDSVNTVWWFSKSDFPKADVKNVLVPYSDRMKKLLQDSDKFYKPNKRPSGHDISSGFGKSNGGAIPPNLLQIPNTESTSQYLRYCKLCGVKGHPARFPAKLPQFFIEFLTDPDDVVLDIFAGSNATGEAAERLKRKWIAFELDRDYLAASMFRFVKEQNESDIIRLHRKLLQDTAQNIKIPQGKQKKLFEEDEGSINSLEGII